MKKERITNLSNEYINIEDLVSNAIPEQDTMTVRVKEVESGKSSQKGTPFVQFNITYRYEGDERSDRITYYLSKKAMPMLGRALFACGVRGTKLPVFNPEFDDAEEFAASVADTLRGMEHTNLTVRVAIEEDDQGVKRNRFYIKGTADGTTLNLANTAASAV